MGVEGQPGGGHGNPLFVHASLLARFLEDLPVAVFVVEADERHGWYANAAARSVLGRGSGMEWSTEPLEDSYRAQVAGTGEPYPMERMPLARALAGEAAYADDVEVVSASGVLDVELWATPVFDDDGRVAYALAAFHDITARRRMEQEHADLYQQATRQNRRLDATHEVFTSILSGAHPDDTLAIVVRRTRELTYAHLATVAVPTDDPTRLRLAAAAGDHARNLRGASLPLDGSVTGEAIRTGRTIHLPDAGRDPRSRQPLVRMGMGPALFIPLAVENRPFGAIHLARRQGWEPFDDREIRLAESFATEAAIAVAYGQARENLARLAVLDDRERIAKDLHDGVIQSLFSVGMGLSGVAIRAQDEDVSRRIEDAVEELDRVIRDVRAYIFSLRSGTLNDQDLAASLQRLAADLQNKSQVVVAVQVDSRAAACLQDRSPEVVHVVREALSNVARHAEAQTCCVRLGVSDGAVVIEVDDDGQGFDPVKARGLGEGLLNLESRAAALGGSLDIDSTTGQGTTVRIRIPT